MAHRAISRRHMFKTTAAAVPAPGSDVQNSILADEPLARAEKSNPAKIEFCTSEPFPNVRTRTLATHGRRLACLVLAVSRASGRITDAGVPNRHVIKLNSDRNHPFPGVTLRGLDR